MLLESLERKTAPRWVEQQRHIYGFLTQYDVQSWEETMKTNPTRANYIFKCACESNNPKSKIETINEAFKVLDRLQLANAIDHRVSQVIQDELCIPTKLEAQHLVVMWEQEKKRKEV